MKRSGMWHMVFGQTTAVSLLWEYALADQDFVGVFLSLLIVGFEPGVLSLGCEPGHQGKKGLRELAGEPCPPCDRAPGCQHAVDYGKHLSRSP